MVKVEKMEETSQSLSVTSHQFWPRPSQVFLQIEMECNASSGALKRYLTLSDE